MLYRAIFIVALTIAGLDVYVNANLPFTGQAPAGTIRIGVGGPDLSDLVINETTVATEVSTQRLLVYVRFSFRQMATYGIQVMAPFELTENIASLGPTKGFEGNVGSANGAQPCYSPSKGMSVANATIQPPPELAKTQSHYEIEIFLDLKATRLVSFSEPSSGKGIIILGFFGQTPLDAELLKCALRLGNMTETLGSPFHVEV